MKVELIETLGSDLTVVNAARVSFDKQHKNLKLFLGFFIIYNFSIDMIHKRQDYFLVFNKNS